MSPGENGANGLAATVLITVELAKDLFGEDDWESAVGQTVYINSDEPHDRGWNH